MSDASKKIIIIGGGPGGYVAAIRAAQLGAQVVLIEKDSLGGTCVNRGCIPTKALLQSADAMAFMKSAASFGVLTEKITFDFLSAMHRKNAVVKQLVDGTAFLLQKNKVTVIKGTGIIKSPKKVLVTETNEEIQGDNIIIATGSKPLKLQIPGLDGSGIWDSDHFLNMERLPSNAVIIGGGVIGLEYAQILHGMGSKVTIIEMMPQLLPREDTEITGILEAVLKNNGIEIFTGATLIEVKDISKTKKTIEFKTKEGIKNVACDVVVVAVGRQPNTDGAGIEKIGVKVERGRIIVNEHLETNVPGVYAIGDVIGGYMLAHVAMHEGKCAVENIIGIKGKMDYGAVPRCVYTSPEMASVGLSETDAAKEHKIKVGKFPLNGNGRAVTINQTTGMIKIIADSEYGEILGVHILASQATELIAEVVLAMHLEATIEDISSAIHAHPTLSETIMEAALAVQGNAVHK